MHKITRNSYLPNQAIQETGIVDVKIKVSKIQQEVVQLPAPLLKIEYTSIAYY
ncbi:MAG: hypothetical protein ACTS85_01050 [Arsenophonus sp. NC-PG7-MAG3]